MKVVQWLLQGLGVAVVAMALLGLLDPIQFRLYFGLDFKHFCETHP